MTGEPAKNQNPFGIRDGEVLPVVGGPFDGESRMVTVLMPETDGGLPMTIWRKDDHFYKLNEAKRRFVYAGKAALTPARPPASEED